MRTVLARVLCLGLAATSPALSHADTAPKPAGSAAVVGPGTTAVKQANTTIADLLKQKPAAGSKEEKQLATKVTTSVRGFLDIDQLGKRAMTDHWAKITKAQQDQFLSLLRQLIEDNYVRGLRANLAYTVSYEGEAPGAEGTIVVSTKVHTTRKGRPFSIAIDYVLINEGGKLRAFDIKTDGVGLVENYRATFNKIVQKDGFDGLLAKMKKKQAEGAAAAAAPAPAGG